MKIRCGECGCEFDVPEKKDDGRIWICPTCVEKRGGVPELPAYKRNPKLRLIRPENGGASGAGREGNSLVSRVTERAKLEERRRRLAKLKKCAASAFWMLVLVGFGLLAYRLCLNWMGKAHDPVLQDVVRMAKGGAGHEDGIQASGERMSKARDGARDGNGSAGSAMQDGLGKPQPLSMEEVRRKFSSCRLSYWGKLPREKRPGGVEAVFHLLVPTRDGKGKYYEVRSSATNVLAMVKITERGPVRFSGSDEYAKLMRSQGGFVLSEGVAYLVMPTAAKKFYQAPLVKGGSFDPAAEMLGAAYPFAKSMDVAGHAFEVLFALNEGDEPMSVATVPFGQGVPYEAFANAAAPIAKVARRKKSPLEAEVKPFVPTVVFSNGLVVSKDGNGVTRVPRKCPAARGAKYDEWVRLKNEALRQESLLQRNEAEMKLLRKQWRERMDAPAQAHEIYKVLAAGKVFVRRKIGK